LTRRLLLAISSNVFRNADHLAFSLLRNRDLNLLKPWQAQPDATFTVPFHDCIFFVRALYGAEFSSRLAEVAQTLDAIAGSQMLATRTRLD
jgi:hypothetical protein